MARNLTASFITAATSNQSTPIMFFEGVFSGSTLRFWNGYGDLSWNSLTWQGNGFFIGVDDAEETDQVEASHLTVVLSGVTSTIVAVVLGSQKVGATGKIWIGYLDASGNVVSDPYLWWSGKYSHSEITERGESSDVDLHYESDLVDIQRPKEFRWTHDSQQYWFPGDLGFQYVVAAANWHGQWGGQKTSPSDQNKKKTKKPKGKR